MSEWQPIETAPSNTEVLVFREDCGALIAQYALLGDLISEEEIEEAGYDEDALWSKDWFGGDSMMSTRLDGCEKPTHWMPLPEPPK